MDHWIKRLSAAGLALSLLMGQAALASDALGHDLHAGTITLSAGAELTRGYFWSDTYSDLRTERYITYTPNEDVRPAVTYGDTVLSKATLSAMAGKLEAAGQRVVGGSNGDFYVVSTGEPLGLVVTEGVVRSSSSYHYAVGFRADGTAFIGTPGLRLTATLLGERLTIFGGLNKIRQVRTEGGGGLTLLTEDFGTTTQNSAPGVDVFLRPVIDEVGETIPAEESGCGQPLTVTDAPRIGGRLRCEVDYVSEAAGSNPIPEGCLVLTMNAQDDEGTLNMLRSLQPGDVVDIDITSEDEGWNEAVEALGGMYRLLDNGQLGPNLSEERTARTAVGVKADGTVIFYTIDGRQPGLSIGATCAQVARRLLELGCVEAIGLDGGGSTTLGVTTPAEETMSVVNSPSDGAQRAVSTALFLTTQLAATGRPSYLQVEPGDALVLAGAELPLTAYEVDTGYRLMGEESRAVYTVHGLDGSVDEDGVFVGERIGTGIITAAARGEREERDAGHKPGAAAVTVVETPDDITISNETTGGTVKALSLDPGEEVLLNAAGSWRKLPLISQDENYTWACDEEVGTVTADGTFTAGAKTASGELRVSAGDRTVTIPVNVAGHINSLDDMEGESVILTSGQGTTVEPEGDLNHVRTGRRSLRVDYDATGTGLARVEAGVKLPAGERYLGMWVYGAGTVDSLTALFADGQGEEQMEVVCGLDFTGWKHVLLPLPQGVEELRALQVVYGGGETASGTFWLDQLTTSNEELEDLTSPAIDLKVTGSKLTASVSDNVDREIPAGSVKVTYDGWGVDFTWNADRGTLTAELPDPGTNGHRVTMTAVDRSGNLGRAWLDIVGDVESPFSDMDDHWAAPYAVYLYQQGITTGVPAGEELHYQPGNQITRAEFFTMAARWMHLDLSKYEDVVLPFNDAGQIPDWALPAVKAMYAENILLGNLEIDGLYVAPNDTITRAQVMTILGRTQGKGWPEAELDLFQDRDQVPDWAEGYVRSLVGQGIINGYEDNTLRPSASMTRGEAAKVLQGLR